jgi:hypothetical protein
MDRRVCWNFGEAALLIQALFRDINQHNPLTQSVNVCSIAGKYRSDTAGAMRTCKLTAHDGAFPGCAFIVRFMLQNRYMLTRTRGIALTRGITLGPDRGSSTQKSEFLAFGTTKIILRRP